MTPVVSVLIPILNPHPVYFPRAIRSVLDQTLADFELIIVEDPSPARTGELLQPFDDPRIRHISNPTSTGLTSQRNQLLREARTELIAFLDADDEMEPDRLEKQLRYMKTHEDIAVLGSQLTIIDASNQIIGHRRYPTTSDEILKTMPRYNAMAQPAVMARKQAILDVGGYEISFPVEDYDLWSRMILAGFPFANLPEALLRYRVTGATKSSRIRDTIRLTRQVKQKHWWNRMTLGDRLRYWGEMALLYLPTHWVNQLFTIIYIQRLRHPPE